MTYDFVFVVLVYRNTQDLQEFFQSCTIKNSKVIVVNSYYDEQSERVFKELAESNNADFISVPNKGYGTGNNRGVEYALNHYTFNYLVISNPDVEIKAMNVQSLIKKPYGIYAPSIHTLSGKQQNPHMPYYNSFIDKIKYNLFCNNNWRGIMFFCALNKLFRVIFFLSTWFGSRKVYSAHGAFVIIPSDIVKKLYPFYDDNVFLFTEEENLAQEARAHGIPTYFVPKIKINHKEDGSTSTIADKQRDITRQSYITFWNKWYKK